MSSHTSLEAAAADRKARLARLSNLKRKQTLPKDEPTDLETVAPQEKPEEDDKAAARAKYLSGRNYDFETDNVKLGFEHDPRAEADTLEKRAQELAQEAAEAERKKREQAAPIDLFQLQPKNPNWDLKRDLDEKLKVLNVRTDNAIARLVRQRIQANQKNAGPGDGSALHDGQAMGVEGITLVEGVHQRETEGPDDEELDD